MRQLWILAGQSNMEGVGLLGGDLEPAPEGARVYTHEGHWTEPAEPLHWLLESPDPVHAELMGLAPEDVAEARRLARETRDRGAGLGIAFAAALRSGTGAEIDLVPCAHGGTSMAQWSPQLRDQGGRSLYGAMLRRVAAALADPDTELAGVLWYQGESDATAALSPGYGDAMVELVESIRRDLDAPELPFLLVQLGTFAQPHPDAVELDPAWTAVREAQRLLPGRLPRVWTVPAIDLALDDPIHIGTASLRRLGRRLARVVLTGEPGIDLAEVEVQGDLVRVRFSGVVGRLVAADPAGRVPGFAIVGPEGAPDPRWVYQATLAPDATDTVLLRLAENHPDPVQVSYGAGLVPFCQLIDEADQAVPAFGPVAAG